MADDTEPPELSRSDMRLLGRAVRQKWPIPDSVVQAAVTRLAMIIADPKQRPRTHVSAIAALEKLVSANNRVATTEASEEAAAEAGELGLAPEIVHTSKVEMDQLRAMSEEELKEFIGKKGSQ